MKLEIRKDRGGRWAVYAGHNRISGTFGCRATASAHLAANRALYAYLAGNTRTPVDAK